jgi:hypothetical protein
MTRVMMGHMRAITRFVLPAVVAGVTTRITTGSARRALRRTWRIPAVAAAAVLALLLTQATASAVSVPSVTITLFANNTVVVGADNFPASSDTTLTAALVYNDGARYGGGGSVRTNASGHFVVGFRLPDAPGTVGLITVTATAGAVVRSVALVIGPGTFSLSPTPTPPASPSTPPAAPAPPASDNDVSGCPTGSELTGAPSGNTFAGHTYNGHGQTLPGGRYTISSNTCVENYVFDGSNLTLDGAPSNVTIVDNTFQNWPGQQAIANVNGTNVNVNYNTVKATAGGAYTGIFGQGTMTNVTVDHNDIQNLGAAVDGVQLRFTGVGTNVSVSYNRISNNGRFPIELQQVVHGLKVLHNYATVTRMGGDQLGQLSIATGNDMDNGGYYSTDTSGVEIAFNVVIDVDGSANPACMESRGNGNNLHDNYCKNFSDENDYAMTNNSSPTPWYVTNNIIIGPGSGSVSGYEGFNRSGYQPVSPTESGNLRFSLSNAPAVPAWNYAAGALPNVP